MSYQSLLYETSERIATITLNRPDRLNSIDRTMPSEIRAAVEAAGADPAVRVIILQGAGRAFCTGYDLKMWAEAKGYNEGFQKMPWDPMVDFAMMKKNTDDFFSLWRSYKPTICKVQGYAVAGGSDIALCCDLVVMAEDAQIGYPPARIWGCPTTAMWIYRIGAERAKRMLLTGDLIDGKEAKAIGLVMDAVPSKELDDRVLTIARRMADVPANQLMMQKLMVNQAYENMGLASTQMMATLFDGIARHTPEGVHFKQRCEQVGFQQAVKERDLGDPLAEQSPEGAPFAPGGKADTGQGR